MNVMPLLVILVLVMCTISVTNVFAQVQNGPALIVHYQFSDMAVSNKNVYVTYQENIGNGAGSSVFFRKSIDGGISFDKIIQLGNGTHSANPFVAASGNNVYVTWMENWGGQGNSYVMFERSTDGGNTFSYPMRLSSDDGDSGPQKIIASGNSVYVLVIYDLQGNTVGRLDLLSSHDGGVTFGNPVTVLEDTQTRGSADFAVSGDGKQVYVFGQESGKCPIETMKCQYQTFLKTSADGGTSFEKPIIIKTTDQPLAYPLISASGDDVYAVWSEVTGNDRDLYILASHDKGSTVSKPTIFSQEIGDSSFPQMSAGGKNVFVSWDYYNGTVTSVFFAKSNDGATAFSLPMYLSGTSESIYRSDLSSYGNNVFVSWDSKVNGKRDVFIKKSSDGGATFGDAVKLTDSKQDYFEIKTMAHENNVYLAINSAYPGEDLFLVSSNNAGDFFGNPTNLNHETTVPEFSFVVPVLLVSITSTIIFYRAKFRK